MAKFELKKMEAVKGAQSFDMLVVDGRCLFEWFEENVEACYKSEIFSLYATMNEVANLKSLPKTKFHPYSDGKDGTREFEFKSKHLRAYAIEKPGGKIVILGGRKVDQPKDEKLFRKYKTQYLESLK